MILTCPTVGIGLGEVTHSKGSGGLNPRTHETALELCAMKAEVKLHWHEGEGYVAVVH